MALNNKSQKQRKNEKKERKMENGVTDKDEEKETKTAMMVSMSPLL